MTRQSFQRGYVSKPIPSPRGLRFKVRFRVPGANGRWKQKNKTIYATSRKVARAELERMIREASAQPVQASDLTFQQFVESYWKPYLDRRNVKPSTRCSYLCALGKHILLVLGDMRLTDITPLHVENLVQGKLDGKRSPKTVRNLVVLLQGIFALALDNDLIGRSPVRSKHKPTVQRREHSTWTPAQVLAILTNAPEAYRALLACAALTGARLGELLALQWKNIDLGARSLRIEKSLWQDQLVPPKTPGSVRTIYFGEALAAAFNEHLRAAIYKGAEDFVFCKQDGSPLNPDVLRKDVLYPTLDRVGIPRSKRDSGFHTFRHSAASFINAQTGDLKLAQKLLGHSTLDMTANIYTHALPGTEREAALAVERAIYGDLFPKLFPLGNKTGNTVVN